MYVDSHKEERMGNDRLIPDKAAHYIGISVHLLNKWRSQGKGPPYYKLGGIVKYKRKDLDEWVEAQRVTPEGQ